MTDKVRLLAAYPRVIETQRRLFELQQNHRSAGRRVEYRNRVAGIFIDGWVEAPARPEDADRPVTRSEFACAGRNDATSERSATTVVVTMKKRPDASLYEWPLYPVRHTQYLQ